ncbi:family 43 glycosylhydrolase [Actinomadura montaniterrae]|uniref:Family 43 glycosylhydrolase n=1 Tax=Actinomadura montaniterrae TaxID=1803903 RepID=A0A6L3VQQ1_9ACTN|nr:family 43 glycosylhydrolase [Actinomadura montaniterrae]KAB2378930.1 family 43 glycosylhydrolase [Actinomadura montaniterrae]
MTYTSIRPGQEWLDTGGERIQAHGGSLLHVDGTFYWYGENKERSKPGSGIWHWGVRCYSSTDLYNWTDEGLIIAPVEDDPESPLHPAQLMDRPHIVRDERAGRYVCWLKIMGTGNVQTSTVLVADHLLGPYEIVRTGLRPLGMNAGDFDLVVAPDDGKGYYYFERVHSELVCADLTEDYTGVTGYYSTHFPRRRPPDVREAPAHFTRDGLHYLFTSGTTAYFPNRSEVAVAETYHGPWTVLGDPHPADPTGTSFRSQISSVFKHPAKKDLYIALADRWLPNVPAELAQQAPDAFRRMFAGEPGEPGTDLAAVEVDTSIADYVWLPVRFEGDMPILDWHDEWRIEDHD